MPPAHPPPPPAAPASAAGAPLRGALIRQHLRALGARWGAPLSVVDVTASTNGDARAAARTGAPHGAAFVADAQHAGRGRGDHRWYSPAGSNIYLSLLVRPELPLAALAPLSLVVGLAVTDVVDRWVGAGHAQLKWPNDVLLAHKKVAGILIESSVRAGARVSAAGGAQLSVIIGVGLNVHSRTFPPELAARATSLALHGARGLSRERIIAELVVAIQRRSEGFFSAQRAPSEGPSSERRSPLRGAVSWQDDFARRDVLRGKPVVVGARSGTAVGIDSRGQLLIRDAAGVRHALRSGEVVW